MAYVRRSVLWLDEAATARNILERSLQRPADVPLDYGQAAPKGFLLLEWLASAHPRRERPRAPARAVPRAASRACCSSSRIARRLLSPAGALAALAVLRGRLLAARLRGGRASLRAGPRALARRAAPRARREAAGISRASGVGVRSVRCGRRVVLERDRAHAVRTRCRVRRDRLAGARAAAAMRTLWPIAAARRRRARLPPSGSRPTASSPRPPSTSTGCIAAGMVPAPRSIGALRWLWDAWRSSSRYWHGWAIDDPAWTSLYVALALIGFMSLLERRAADAIIVGSRRGGVRPRVDGEAISVRDATPARPIAVFLLGVGESIGVLADRGVGTRDASSRVSLAVLLCVPPVYHVVAFPAAVPVDGDRRVSHGDPRAVAAGRRRVLDVRPSAGGAVQRAALRALGARRRAGPLQPRGSARGVARGGRAARASSCLGDRGERPLLSGRRSTRYLRAIGVRRDSLPVRPARLGSGLEGQAPFDISTAYLFDLSDTTRLQRATADTYTISPLLRPPAREHEQVVMLRRLVT